MKFNLMDYSLLFAVEINDGQQQKPQVSNGPDGAKEHFEIEVD